jgi:hypothetical protein
MFDALPFLTRKLSFQDHQIVMIPDPREDEWTVPGVLFFPARFKGRKQQYVGTKNEFNFTFFNNYIHWPLERDAWRLNLTMEMFSRDRKFCEAIACTPLTTAQVCRHTQWLFMS